MLYREWFVHLRFPGHEHVKIIDGVPEGWERSTLGDVATSKYGRRYDRDEDDICVQMPRIGHATFDR